MTFRALNVVIDSLEIRKSFQPPNRGTIVLGNSLVNNESA